MVNFIEKGEMEQQKKMIMDNEAVLYLERIF